MSAHDDRSAEVVISGLGTLSPAGRSLADVWRTMIDGRSLARPLGAGPVDPEDPLLAPTACPVDDGLASDVLGEKDRRRMHRYTRYAVVAGLDAVGDAALAAAGSVEPGRKAIVAATGLAGVPDDDTANLSPVALPTELPNASACTLAIRLNWSGPCTSLSSMCAGSLQAIGEAWNNLRADEADVGLAGGSDALVGRAAMTALSRAGLVAGAGPQGPVPVPAGSRAALAHVVGGGWTLGEGGAFCVLEAPGRLERHRGRPRRPYAKVLGYACTGTHDIWSGAGRRHRVMAHCVREALARAAVDAGEVGCIFASAGGLDRFDACEAMALDEVFDGRPPPVACTSSVVGRMLGADGAFAVLVACLGLREAVVPPVSLAALPRALVGFDVSDRPRPMERPICVVTAFSVSGQNAALVLEAAS